MNPTEVPKFDKQNWARGEWDREPDRVEWKTAAGYPALIRRARHGALCGYVAVPPGHPLHGKSYADDEVQELEVHGGITYGDACKGDICHVPTPGEPEDVWWLGFDAIHHADLAPSMAIHPGDLAPSMVATRRGPCFFSAGVYRNIEYMARDCESLAEQLRELA